MIQECLLKARRKVPTGTMSPRSSTLTTKKRPRLTEARRGLGNETSMGPPTRGGHVDHHSRAGSVPVPHRLRLSWRREQPSLKGQWNIDLGDLRRSELYVSSQTALNVGIPGVLLVSGHFLDRTECGRFRFYHRADTSPLCDQMHASIKQELERLNPAAAHR